jgi:hypothetical protein
MQIYEMANKKFPFKISKFGFTQLFADEFLKKKSRKLLNFSEKVLSKVVTELTIPKYQDSRTQLSSKLSRFVYKY